MSVSLRTPALVALGLLLLAGCRSAEAPPPPASLEVDARGPRELLTLPAVEVTGLSGPGDTPFSVALRTPSLTQFPCQSCHGTPVKVRAASSGPRAHPTVEPVHPDGLATRCATCHDGTDLERLRLQDGSTVSLDEAYRLCRQCHYRQVEEWAAGGHGKRLGGWRGERVVLSCTGCHDPHAPRTPRRMPVEFPRIPHTTPLDTGH